MSTKKLRTNYGARVRVYSDTVGPSATKISHKDECDINSIMRRYEKTGILPDLIKAQPEYGDFAQMASFQEAQNIVVLANEQFAALSAHVRERFGNSPAKFLEFAQNPRNQEEMVSLGLATRKSTADNVAQNTPNMGGGPKGSPKAKKPPTEADDQAPT
ncbi:MAG: internal scaffolding protein [Arizlama microvirus]|nr:MAG: internal scaffolding protein [Arizlama microvirus]